MWRIVPIGLVTQANTLGEILDYLFLSFSTSKGLVIPLCSWTKSLSFSPPPFAPIHHHPLQFPFPGVSPHHFSLYHLKFQPSCCQLLCVHIDPPSWTPGFLLGVCSQYSLTRTMPLPLQVPCCFKPPWIHPAYSPWLRCPLPAPPGWHLQTLSISLLPGDPASVLCASSGRIVASVYLTLTWVQWVTLSLWWSGSEHRLHGRVSWECGETPTLTS